MQIMTVSAMLGALLVVTAAQAQDIGNIRQGLQFARDVCGSCHAVRARQTRSPLATAPTLEAIAKTPGMTATALTFWLTAHSHPTMPNLILSSQQLRDASAYILSLKELADPGLDESFEPRSAVATGSACAIGGSFLSRRNGLESRFRPLETDFRYRNAARAAAVIGSRHRTLSRCRAYLWRDYPRPGTGACVRLPEPLGIAEQQGRTLVACHAAAKANDWNVEAQHDIGGLFDEPQQGSFRLLMRFPDRGIRYLVGVV
jgi:hypothetical protein